MNQPWSAEAAIGEFCETGSGGTPDRSKEEFYGGDIPWVKSGELRERVIFDTEEHLTEAGLKNSSAKLVPAGAILIAMYGATVGRLALLGRDAATNQAVCNIRPHPDRADTRYLFRALEAKVPYLIRIATGGAQPNISQDKVRNTKVRLPPLDEQRRIAAILDKADALRQKRKRAIALLDSLTQSVFLDMFGGGGSRTRPLGEVVKVLNGAGFPLEEQGLSVGDVPFYKVSDMNLPGNETEMSRANNYISRDTARRLGAAVHPAGAIIFPKIGAAIATNKKRILTLPSAFDNNVVGLFADEKNVTRDYVFAFIQGIDLSVLAQPGNPPSIRKSTIESFEMPVPQMDDQLTFAKRTRQIASQMATLTTAHADSDALFSSLQHRAFSGQL